MEGTGLSGSVVVDSKAMRKLRADETLIIVVEVAASRDQAGSLDWSYWMRGLFAV